MTPAVSHLIELVFALVGALIVPWLGMRMLLPALEAAQHAAVTNYRGRRVVAGLGLVWVLWVIGVTLAGALLDVASARLSATWTLAPSATALTILSAPVLVLGAFALGFADDAFGTSAERGFRGHLAALRSGRLTTGGLKLLGIGLLSAALTMRGAFAAVDGPLVIGIGRWALATCAVALSANLINLMDLRPGRALKVYSAVCVLLVAIPGIAYGFPDGALALVLLLGPVVAVWHFDLGERAMLGDAGANPAGALMGWVAVQMLASWWQLALYVAIVLALNLASEKVSFSRVIEGTAALRWLDGLGRLPDETPATSTIEETRRTAATPEK